MLTRLQQHRRREFDQRQNSVRQRRRIGAMQKKAWESECHAAAAIKEMESLRNRTVKLGMERGIYDPMFALQVSISPRDFQYAMRMRDAERCQAGFANVSYYARMVAEETALKIERLLVDFCTDKDRLPR